MILFLLLPPQIVMSLCTLIMLECLILTFNYQCLMEKKKKEYVPKSHWRRRALQTFKNYYQTVRPVAKRWCKHTLPYRGTTTTTPTTSTNMYHHARGRTQHTRTLGRHTVTPTYRHTRVLGTRHPVRSYQLRMHAHQTYAPPTIRYGNRAFRTLNYYRRTRRDIRPSHHRTYAMPHRRRYTQVASRAACLRAARYTRAQNHLDDYVYARAP
jgi:hypothetical protein